MVTGASSGIGYELARQFAAHGFDVIVAAEDDRIQHVTAELSQAEGSRAESVQADLATCEGVERLCSAIGRLGLPVDAVALNAGVGVSGGPTDTEFFARPGMEDTRAGAKESKDDAAEVAQEAYEALMKGQDHVITGSARNKAQVATSRLMSEKAKAAVHRQLPSPAPATKIDPYLCLPDRSSLRWRVHGGSAYPIGRVCVEGFTGAEPPCVRVALGSSWGAEPPVCRIALTRTKNHG